MSGTPGITRRRRVLRALAFVTAMLVVASCSGTANQPSPSPTPGWADRTVAELAAIMADPAAATACEDGSALACDRIKAEVAAALGDKLDPAAVAALVAAVEDPGTYDEAREAAWDALEKIGGPDVMAFLVESITTWQPQQAILGRAERADKAADVLGRIGGVEHNQILAQSTYAACQNNGFTDALVAINRADVTPLLDLLESYETVGVYGPLIRIGQPGTEKALLVALQAHGVKDMAECFVNSGNAELVEAAQQWVADRGYWTLGIEGLKLWGSN